MNKEEQIKRLAQNLNNKGFTSSMDVAVTMAAKMLGFSDDMLRNELMDKEASNYNAESILNGGIHLGRQRQSASPSAQEPIKHNEEISSRDLSKKITQQLAEERVYEMVPGASAMRNQSFESEKQVSNQEISDIAQNTNVSENFENQVQQRVSQEQPINNQGIQQNNANSNQRFEEFDNVEKPQLSINFESHGNQSSATENDLNSVKDEVRQEMVHEAINSSEDFLTNSAYTNEQESNLESSANRSFDMEVPQEVTESVEISEENLFTSAPNISEMNSETTDVNNEDIFDSQNIIEQKETEEVIENPNFANDYSQDEQTSLISGFMNNQQNDFQSNEMSAPSSLADTTENAHNENMFGTQDNSVESSFANSQVENNDSQESFIDSSEDFFTPALAQKQQESTENSVSPSSSVEQAPEVSSGFNGTNTVSSFPNNMSGANNFSSQTETAKAESKPADNSAEAQVDITQMFDFRNLKQ